MSKLEQYKVEYNISYCFFDLFYMFLLMLPGSRGDEFRHWWFDSERGEVEQIPNSEGVIA